MPTETTTRHPAPHAVALMYHALTHAGVPAGQDPHYTLAASDFSRQLDFLGRGPGHPGCARDWLAGSPRPAVLITFDDGHASNYGLAFPALAERGIRADFFVNPAVVGTSGFACWKQLREMSDAGMSIQSHGYDHVYLTGLGDRALRETLRKAREEISQRVGAEATLLAPPGGRMPRHLVEIARECGYTHVLSSRPGVLGARARAAGNLPRMAMTATIGDPTFQRWIARDVVAIRRERVRYASLALAKKLLGDDRYERVRAGALGMLRGSA